MEQAKAWLTLPPPPQAIPLTWPQLERLSVCVVLERLVARRLFPVALEIARILKKIGEIGTEFQEPRILAHWACYKVRNPPPLFFFFFFFFFEGLCFTKKKTLYEKLQGTLLPQNCRLGSQTSLLLNYFIVFFFIYLRGEEMHGH